MCRDTRIDQGAGPVSICCQLWSLHLIPPSAHRLPGLVFFARSSIFPTPPKYPSKLGHLSAQGDLPIPQGVHQPPLCWSAVYSIIPHVRPARRPAARGRTDHRLSQESRGILDLGMTIIPGAVSYPGGF